MRSKVDQKRVLALLPAFIALTYILHGQIFTRMKSELARLPTNVTATQQETLPLERQPSSVSSADSSVLEFDCTQKNSPSHQLDKRYVRIVGKKCPRSVKVTADTYDYSPEIFWTSRKEFSTELIHLKKGANSIRISMGKESHNVSIQRQ